MRKNRLISLAAAAVLLLGSAQAAKAPTLQELQAEMEGRSAEEIRSWCAEQFESAVHADPADIPWPDNRQEDGYLPEGEFVFEDPEQGMWAYLSPSLQVEIVRYDMSEPPQIWYEANVIFRPEQEIFQQYTYVNAKFRNQEIWPATLAQTSRLVFAMNADYHLNRVNQKWPTGNIIRRGEVLYSADAKKGMKFPNLDTLAIRNDGSFSVYDAHEVTAEELLAQAEPGDPSFVHDALSFGPYLIRDGQIRLYDGNSADVPEPRSAYGMIRPGHLFFVMVEGKIPKKNGLRGEQGLNLWQLAQLMYARGCTEALNVDGGSTAVMLFMGERLNRTGKATALGSPRNQHELFGIGISELVHTDKMDGEKK
jgi:hypothetical protein